MGPWAMVDVLARAMLNKEHEAWTTDPLWATLATLDGREPHTMPGEGYAGADRFTLPKPWLTPALHEASGPYHWAVRQGRLRLWAEAGWLLADLPLDEPSSLTQARCVLASYNIENAASTRRAFDAAPLAEIAGTLAEDLDAGLKRWLSQAFPYICYRLARALGHDATDPSGLAETLLCYPARLHCTTSHLDVVLLLETVSLPLRYAGLDQDPGWMPSLGRVILFHFE